MDVTLSGWMLLAALVILTLPLLILLSMLALLLMKQSRLHTQSLRSQNLSLWKMNQSLVNQLRASDLPSLAGLQQITESSTSKEEEEWIPTYDEAITYAQQIAESGNYTQEGISDDLDARGWEPTVTPVSSGSAPVRFTE